MALSIKALIESWEGLGVVMKYDQPTGTWIFIALHDDTLGMPSGGTRLKSYASPAAALRDAMRLAEGMTNKWAAVDINFGGGKAVLATTGPLTGHARQGLLRRYGRLLASLHGSFGTGVDLGTTPEDMLVIGTETEYVHGVDRKAGTTVDPGPYTAHGVFSGIKAAAKHVFGTDSLKDRVVHVQGVGDVGRPLAKQLREAGARLILSDIDTKRAQALAEALGTTETFEPHTAYQVACDVYAPCAVGGTLNSETIPELKCRIVAGSANNQLEAPEHAAQLHEKGILYAPDYIVNAGGAVALAMIGQGESDQTRILDRVTNIGQSLSEILVEAAGRNESPTYAAARVVAKRLDASRQNGKRTA
jgi:leucine dehydrogenase